MIKVLLYSEGLKYIAKSGIGKAIKHQMKALEANDVPYTLNKKEDYSIVHINTYGIASYLLARSAKKRGKKVIIHAHSTEEDFRDSFLFSNWIAPLFKKWLVFVYRQADQIITPTPYSKKILESYPLDVPIEAVSNGIDLTGFETSQKLRKQFRETYSFSKDDKVIMCVGLHIKRKGIFDFIELAEKMPEYKFVWCGYTNPLLVPKEVRKLIKSPPSNVHFLGYVNDMRMAYSGTDLFLMLSYEETEGIVVLESLSAKKPVIVRDIGVYETWLENRVHCYKATNSKEFESIIRKYFNKNLDNLANNGYAVVKERSLEKIGSILKSIYSRTIRTI